MHTVTVQEAQARLPALIKEAGRGDEILITENDKPVAKLGAPPETPHQAKTEGWPVIGMLKGGIQYREGWEDTPEGFTSKNTPAASR